MSKYRDELVQTIKLMGQELIDRAESMVHEDCDMIANFNINIDIPQPMDGYPELTWSTSALCKNFYNKEIGHSAGDACMKTHIETITVEKDPSFLVRNFNPLNNVTQYKCLRCGYTSVYPGCIFMDEHAQCPECK